MVRVHIGVLRDHQVWAHGVASPTPHDKMSSDSSSRQIDALVAYLSRMRKLNARLMILLRVIIGPLWSLSDGLQFASQSSRCESIDAREVSQEASPSSQGQDCQCLLHLGFVGVSEACLPRWALSHLHAPHRLLHPPTGDEPRGGFKATA